MEKALTQWQHREAYRRMRRQEEKRGFRIHRRVYFAVIPLLALVNLVFVPQFLWFVFPLVGWGVGLTMHYVFGVRKLERMLRREEERIRAAVEGIEGGTQ